MLFKAPILTVLLSLSGANAACYGTGEFFAVVVGKDTARQHIRNACHGWYNGAGQRQQGFFENTYFKPNSESPWPASVCINHWNQGLGIPYSIIFEVTNKENSGRTLPQNLCEDGLMSEVNSCNAGGESTKWGWHFRADVNQGAC